jgi:hypothetical protein
VSYGGDEFSFRLTEAKALAKTQRRAEDVEAYVAKSCDMREFKG